MELTRLAGCVAVAAAMSGCGSTTSTLQTYNKGGSATESLLLKDDGATNFGLALLTQLTQVANETKESRGGANLLLAPQSVATTMAMLAAGGRGETQEQMTKALGYASVDEMNAAAGAHALQLAQLTGDGVDVASADRLWVDQRVSLTQAYQTSIAEHYGATVGKLALASQPEPSRVAINDWVAGKTGGLIKDMLAPGALGGNVGLVVTDALHFKADWQKPFGSDQTIDATFALSAGGHAPVRMMQTTNDFAYSEGDGWQMLELPYKGGRLVMDVLLPTKPLIAPLLASGGAAALTRLTAKARSQQVAVQLPSFQFEASLSLAKVLANVGMAKAFSASADFSGITGKPDLQLGDVLHKTYIAVTEKGTEAGASTAGIVYLKSRDGGPLSFVADHPFLFLVRDKGTGTLLLAGVYGGPSSH